MGMDAMQADGQKSLILGTAGHIDHGKSSLVKALTGTDPDRLPEEQRRGMTIELGFAHLDVTTEGRSFRFGIVDVPGHERFVRTMVAGATGIDIAILVVAADDGWMPQTQEHADILDLLGIESGIITMTKSDAVPRERLSAVRDEIAEHVRGTVLATWPVLESSARTGAGVDELRSALAAAAAELHARTTTSVFRLAIDRVFSVHGRGTVVTGSVLSGHVHVGDELELLPPGKRCKVREVQTHGEMVDDAIGGQRAALNLTGIDRESIDRGMELASPGYLSASRYVDARVRILGDVGNAFRSHRRVRLLIGTTEAMATLVVIGADSIAAGGEAFVQLRVHRPIVAGFGQRFIIRDETATATIGGGVVIRPQARRVRPKLAITMQSFEAATSDDAAIRLAEALRDAGFEPLTTEALAGRIGVESDDVKSMMRRLADAEVLVDIDGIRVHRGTLERLLDRTAVMLKRHHAMRPGEPGIQRDRMIGWISARSAPNLGKRLLTELATRGIVIERGPYCAHRDFRPAMSIEDESAMAKVVAEIESAGFDPPEWDKLRAVRGMSRQRARSLADIAKTDPRLVSYALGFYISTRAMDQFRGTVEQLGEGGRRFKLADVRDKTGQSRRVVQPLLEHLDRIGVTKRVGDERILL
ncbi:MAG: selenocysteine-specific translation elongation factor [Phycisphaerales bacterium]|nr:selenocysteine-specific translation elongation factor [Phycisphaerales bacterium]MCB9854398.1 selenocysteine-specific translation elongation factor [Phycisphaerales bacterium]MCB9863599.1 selenocysteine-specific translation elongation factor [Phycisphaerales bacterium]